MKQSPALRQKKCRVTTRARGTERKQEGRDNACECVCVWAVFHFCGCRHVKATSGFCILSRELTVQLTGQVCVPLPFILGRFLRVCCNVHVKTFACVWLLSSLCLSSSLPFLPAMSDCLDINYIVISNSLWQQYRQIWHCFLQNVACIQTLTTQVPTSHFFY